MTTPHDPFSKEPPPPGYGPPSGYGPPPGYPMGQAQGTNTLAIISFVAAFFCSPAAIVTGFLSLGQIKRTHEGGRGLAIAGIVIGSIAIVVAILAVVAAFAFSSSFSCSSVTSSNGQTVSSHCGSLAPQVAWR